MKTQEQLLKEALELITMIDGLKESQFPKIMQLMVSKQYIDAGIPVTEDMQVVGDVMSDYQKTLATLVESTRAEHNLLATILQNEGEPSSDDTKVLARLKEEYTALSSSFWATIFKTHGTYMTNTSANTALVEVEGFRIAEQQAPLCPHCGERHPQGEVDDDTNFAGGVLVIRAR